MSKLHVHVGHHFFGSGNLGDDLMLAGFLAAARPRWLAGVRLTCCSPHARSCQRRRFPEIDWLPYDPATREACIRQCDVWLGLGDTPFQATGGHTWFLDHLSEEAAWCRASSVPMFYLGVGVHERAIVDRPQTRLLIGQAKHLWMRDDDSAEALRPIIAPGQATAHGDLAHLALTAMQFPTPEPGTLGLVLNFEDPAQFQVEHLTALIRAADGRRVRWLVQEIRPLDGSETVLHARLPPGDRAAAPTRMPDYAGAPTARALLTPWEGMEALFVSRYHAALIGAWMGARVAIFARSDKVAGAARQLGLPVVPRMADTPAILRAVAEARTVERHRLLDLAARAREACEEFFALARARPGPLFRPLSAETDSLAEDFSPESAHMPPRLPTRILFLRPDAYGDLFLFEPVPRIVRDAWPQAEVAVLIRQPYADAAPLLASAAGVRWLTTTCNPYRHGPGDDPAALAALRKTVRAFAPDCLVAACAEQTWLESAAAAFLPDVRQVSLGPGLTDPLARAALEAVLPVAWAKIYPEKIPVEPAQPEWEKNLGLASALLGREAPRWWPVATVPDAAKSRAARVLADAGLAPGAFVACAAAGTANVQIKNWPAGHYGQTLAWLEHTHGVRALLIGHVSERAHLETVRAAARQAGAAPALWLGEDGEMPVGAGLLAAARFYFGNDTGALHLAAALGRPVLPIFGGGTWPRFQPVARRSLTVVQPLPCFGCGWDCHYADAPCVRTISPAAVQSALGQFLQDDAEGRIIFEAEGLEPGARALIEAATPRLRFLREDSTARLRQTRELTVLLRTSETDRAARLLQVDELTAALQTSEADRAARAAQVKELTALLQVSEADRAARAAQVADLTPLLQTSEADRVARGQQVAELTALLQTSEADRAARQVQIDELTAALQASEADRAARAAQVKELTALLQTSEEDRAARAAQIEELTAWLRTSEADRADRQVQIDQLTTWLLASNADHATQAKHILDLTARIADLTARRGTGRATAEPDDALLAEEATPDAMAPTSPAPTDPPEGSDATSKLTPSRASGTSLPDLTGTSRVTEHLS